MSNKSDSVLKSIGGDSVFSADKTNPNKYSRVRFLQGRGNTVTSSSILALVIGLFGLFVMGRILSTATVNSDGYLTSFQFLTFERFLSVVQGTPQIPLDWLNVFNINMLDLLPSSWSWLASFLQVFVNLFRSSLFLSTAILNALTMILYFVSFLLVG